MDQCYRTLRVLLALTLSVFVGSYVSAQAPASTPMSGEDVSEALEAIRADAGVPGMVTMLIQDGEVVAWGAAGTRVFGKPDPVQISDAFHLGSCSKAITATLVAVLIEEGLLAWDTTIFEVLPELKETSDAGFASATIEHLLQHRAGIAERQREEVANIYESFGDLEGTAVERRLQAVRMALRVAPRTPPGAVMDYSNYGYMTAAAMIERLTKRSWEELIIERVLVPLKMTTAGVGSPAGEGVAVGHERVEDAWVALVPGPEGRLPDIMGPAGLLHSNLIDWSKFVVAHLAGARGEDGLLKAATFKRLHADPGTGAYACGWGLGRRIWSWGEGATLGHNGSDGTWFSQLLAMPEWDLIVLSAANGADSAASAAGQAAIEHLLGVAGFTNER